VRDGALEIPRRRPIAREAFEAASARQESGRIVAVFL